MEGGDILGGYLERRQPLGVAFGKGCEHLAYPGWTETRTGRLI
jgi:hypothetical protein